MATNDCAGSAVVGDIMTPAPATLHATCSLRAAVRLLAGRAVEYLPFVLGRRLVGILADRDVNAAVARRCNLDMDIAGLMAPNPKTVSPATPLLEAAQLLVSNRIHCLPVVDHRQAVVGIVTPTDLLRAFIRVCTGEPRAA